MARNLLYFFFLLTLPLSSAAQAYEWSVVLAAPDDSWGSKTAVDTAGNVYFACYAADSLPYVTTNDTGEVRLLPYYANSLVMKYSPAGELVSRWIISPSNPTRIFDIEVDQAGNHYLLLAARHPILLERDTDSVYFGFPDYSTTSKMLLIKLDPAGNPLWHYQINSNVSHRPTLAIDHTGNVFIAGEFDREFDVDPDPNVTDKIYTTHKGIFVIKFDAQGNILWRFANGAEVSSPLYNFALETDPAGNLLIYGNSHGLDMAFQDAGGATTTVSSSGHHRDFRSFLQKVDPNGNQIFAHFWDAEFDNTIKGVTATSDGKTFLTGTYNPVWLGSATHFDLDPGPDSLMAPAPGNSGTGIGTFLISLDSTGTLVWGKTLRSDDSVEGYQIAMSDDGWLLVAGSSFGVTDFDPGPLNHFLSPSHTVMAYLLALDTSGNLKNVWTSQGDAESASFFTDIEYVPGMGLYLHGETGYQTDLDPGPGVSPTIPFYGNPNN